MSTEDRIRQSFAAQSMMTTLGAELVEIGEGRVVIAAPILPGSRQQHDFAHAALTFAIGDSAAGYAALTCLPEGQDVLTAEMKINLLAPAKGDRLVAVGRVEKAGRRLIVVSAEVFAETGQDRRRVAILQGTIMPVDG